MLELALNSLIYGLTISIWAFITIWILTPRWMLFLKQKGKVVDDYHKPGKPKIPRPAGPVLALGICGGELILFFLTNELSILLLSFASILSFVIGIIDDKKVMPGWFKPLSLVLAALPLTFFLSTNSLNLIFGSVLIPVLYIPLILIIIPITGNTVNSIDVFNGVVSGFMIISSIPLLISIAVFSNVNILLAALPLFFGLLAFYKFHKYPSKIFPGDSGTLLIGTTYGALAVLGNSEVIGVIALLPAVINSFLFLESMRKVVEHRQVKSRPTILTEDYNLKASDDPNAPNTLVRLILANGPLSENEISKEIFKLALLSALLSIVTIFIQHYFIFQK